MTANVRPSTLSVAIKFTTAVALLAAWILCPLAPAMASEIAPPEPPITQPCEATIPTADVETFCGTLNPHMRARTGYYFAYSANPPCTAGARTATQELEGEDVAVFGEASGLELNTPYAVCLVAVNVGGETVGNEIPIVTPPAPPALLELSASSISQHDAVLEVEINPYGLATTYEFRLEAAPGVSEITSGSIRAGHGKEKVSVDLADVGQPLAAATSYGYSVRATNSAGGSATPRQSFTTLAEPLPAVPDVPAAPLVSTAPVAAPPAVTPKQGPSAASLPSPTSKRGAHRLTQREKLKKALRACDRRARGARAQCRPSSAAALRPFVDSSARAPRRVHFRTMSGQSTAAPTGSEIRQQTCEKAHGAVP
jgi:hypothetical protein